MSKILGIESSSLVASVAILDGDTITAEYTVNHKKTHSQTLLPMLDEIVRMTEQNLEDLDAIAVSGGPGSFTGLRIGSATAKGLGLALEKPLIHVPTLDAMAYNLYGCGERICPIMDARRGQVYTGIYRFEDNTFRTLKEDCAIALEELLEELAAAQEPVVFLGDGVPVGREKIAARLGSLARFAPAQMNRQRAASVAALGAVMYAEGKTETAAAHAPEYLRMSQAERERKAKGLPVSAEVAAGELAAAALMEAELFSDAWTEVSLQELLANPCNHAYELRIGEDAAAYCLTCEILDEGEILRIGTLRKYQNGGAGSFLLQDILRRRAEITCWNLEVRESNLAAAALYQKCRFEVIGIRKNYYSSPTENAVLMQRKGN